MLRGKLLFIIRHCPQGFYPLSGSWGLLSGRNVFQGHGLKHIRAGKAMNLAALILVQLPPR